MRSTALRWTFVVVAVVGLGIDAYTHLDLASLYSHSTTSITQQQLFYVEAVLAIVVAVALLFRVNLWTVLAAFLVPAGGLALLLLYRYVNVGTIGPIPNMYEPLWYDEKSVCAWFEAVAAIASAALMVFVVVPQRRALRSSM
jgi:hypothetical protein